MLNFRNIRLIAPYKLDGIKSTGLWELEAYLKYKSIICLDCETTGLDPYTSKIVMLQIGDIHRQFIIDTRYTDISCIYDWIRDKKIVGHNIKFDYKQLKYHYNWRLLNLYDSMVVEKLLNNNKKEEEEDGFYALSGLASRYLGAEFNPTVKKGKKIVDVPDGFVSFYTKPTGSGRSAHIMGISHEGIHVKISTTSIDLADLLARAYNAGGYSDADVLFLSKYHDIDEVDIF